MKADCVTRFLPDSDCGIGQDAIHLVACDDLHPAGSVVLHGRGCMVSWRANTTHFRDCIQLQDFYAVRRFLSRPGNLERGHHMATGLTIICTVPLIRGWPSTNRNSCTPSLASRPVFIVSRRYTPRLASNSTWP